ncbi:MAG: glycyl-tRNA synthetase [Candidatus Syntrophoarchaeum sp. GoM_oil]|nr:MAG: glycyl-tRNA synthetase [Candidatus Syntrophoarchaeum sp. GoM_oil]
MDIYDEVMELAKRRGFLWPSFEIYGGTAGFYDYGPLGARLKRNIEDVWRKFYVVGEGFYEIETPIIGLEEIFRASGHLSSFTDPIVECKSCKEFFREDHVGDGCPVCGGEFGEASEFHLMFKTFIGPGSKRAGYLRPETAQGMFVDFPRLLRFFREKLPFGAVQIGKAFRNEISPRQGLIRLREFTQAEAEIFVDPKNKTHPGFEGVKDEVLMLLAQGESEAAPWKLSDALNQGIIANEFLAYHVYLTYRFLIGVGISEDRLRFRQHESDEMAHYAADCWDAEILLDRLGWIETVGIADRTDYDLKAHEEISKVDLGVFMTYSEPKVIERIEIKPNMQLLGPRFKGDAKRIGDLLSAMDAGGVGDQDIVIDLDGKEVTVTQDMFDTKCVKEEVRGEKVNLHVIEPSYGIDRIFYAVIEHAFFEEEVEGEKRAVLKLLPNLAPIQVCVLPLLGARDELVEVARDIHQNLRKAGLIVEYDGSGTIGRRYRRQDEIGTPFCITVDYDTLEDDTVTVRFRDSMEQLRVKIDELYGWLISELGLCVS